MLFLFFIKKVVFTGQIKYFFSFKSDLFKNLKILFFLRINYLQNSAPKICIAVLSVHSS